MRFFTAEGSAFNGDILLLRNLSRLLGDGQLQDTVFKLALNVLLSHILAYIEGSLAGPRIALSADVTAGFLLLLVLIKALGGADGQIAVL